MNFNNEQICILELIKASLFSIKPSFPEKVDWDKVFEIAKLQCIVALVEPAVPYEFKNPWTIVKYQNIAHFVKISYEQNDIVRMFKEHGIPMVIIKGMAAAMYYPEPVRRTMGDIDFFVPPDKLLEAKSLLEENGFSYVDENYRHIEYKKHDIEFELHWKVCSQHYKDIENVYVDGMNHTEEYGINGSVFDGFPNSLNGLIILGHFMQHLKGSGIGIRHLIDWMMFVHKELDDESWDKIFRPLAEAAGLEKLAITITYLCKTMLGFPDEITWCDDADEELAESVLERVLIDGNFGIARSESEKIRISAKKNGVFSFVQKAGVANWKFAQKYPIFQPLAWIYQIFRYIKKIILGVFTGKISFRRNKHKMEIEEIWRRLE